MVTNGHHPVLNTNPDTAPELLGLTFCKCEGMCKSNKCSCYKNNVECLLSNCDRYADELSCGNYKITEGLYSVYFF